MSNSIRTPKQGRTEHSRRIAAAVDDEDWQKFRIALKGLSTDDKLSELEVYWDAGWAFTPGVGHDTLVCRNDVEARHNCDACIRVDNYLKALARGGQLPPGVSLDYALNLGDITLLPVRK